jgi:hypothetical protein
MRNLHRRLKKRESVRRRHFWTKRRNSIKRKRDREIRRRSACRNSRKKRIKFASILKISCQTNNSDCWFKSMIPKWSRMTLTTWCRWRTARGSLILFVQSWLKDSRSSTMMKILDQMKTTMNKSKMVNILSNSLIKKSKNSSPSRLLIK